MLLSFGHHVASNSVFNIIQRFFCSKVWKTVLHLFGHRIQQCCTRACAAATGIHGFERCQVSSSFRMVSEQSLEYLNDESLSNLSSNSVRSSQGHGAHVSAGSFASQDPGTLLPTQWCPGSLKVGWGLSRPWVSAWCKTFGDRAFAVAVPRFWKSRVLAITESDSIDNFKRNLKTPTWRKFVF